MMKEFGKIAKRRILKSKTERNFIIGTIILVVATQFIALSLSENFIEYFILKSGELTGNGFAEVLQNGFKNIAVILVVLLTYIFYILEIPIGDEYREWMEAFTNTEITKFVNPNRQEMSSLLEVIAGKESEGSVSYIPVFENGDSIFSANAMVENIPAIIILVLIVLLIITKLALSTVFLAFKREKKSFFAVLIASGANKKQLKVCALYESVHYCALAIPLGIILGTIGLYATKYGATRFFQKLAESNPGLNFNINIKFSLLAMLIIIPLIFLFVYSHSKKAFKKLSVKTIASDVKKRFVMSAGKCVATAKSKTYKILGLQHFISTRNFVNNLGGHIKIIFMVLVYTLVISITFLMLDIIRNYNVDVFATNNALLSLNYSLGIYFVVIVATLAVTTMFSIFCAISANIDANISEYAMMRLGGAKMKSVLNSVRSEGLLCIFTGIVSCGIVFAGFMMLTSMMFVDILTLEMFGLKTTILLVVISILVFAVSVLLTILSIKKKMKELDMISVLKEAFY